MWWCHWCCTCITVFARPSRGTATGVGPKTVVTRGPVLTGSIQNTFIDVWKSNLTMYKKIKDFDNCVKIWHLKYFSITMRCISRNVRPFFDMAITFISMQCGCAYETNRQLSGLTIVKKNPFSILTALTPLPCESGRTCALKASYQVLTGGSIQTRVVQTFISVWRSIIKLICMCLTIIIWY